MSLENTGGSAVTPEGSWSATKKEAFLENEVEYLGNKITEKGLHPVKSKVQAIVEALALTNVTELKVYLCLLNYYNKFRQPCWPLFTIC